MNVENEAKEGKRTGLRIVLFVRNTTLWKVCRNACSHVAYRIRYHVNIWRDFTFNCDNFLAIDMYEAIKKKQNIEIKILEKSRDCMVCKPYYWGRGDKRTIHMKIPDRYCATIDNCTIVGGIGGVINGSYFIYDIACEKDGYRYDLSIGESMKHKGRRFRILKREGVKKCNKGLLLCTSGGFNYFHFLFGAITKLVMLDRETEYDDYAIIVDSRAYNNSNMRELLDTMNIKKRELIVVEELERCVVDKLLIASDSLYIPLNVKGRMKPKDFLLDWENVLNVRKKIITLLDIHENETGRRIFISRRKQAIERLKNSLEVERLFHEKGFDIVYPEELSFAEQVQMFYDAEWVAGTSGAAMSNILFCRPNTKFICIFPQKGRFYSYSTIAEYMGINTVFVDAKVVKHNKYMSAWEYTCRINDCVGAIEELEMMD